MLRWLPIFVLLIQMQQKGREFVFDRMTFPGKEKTVYKTTDGNKFSHGNVAIRSHIVKILNRQALDIGKQRKWLIV